MRTLIRGSTGSWGVASTLAIVAGAYGCAGTSSKPVVAVDAPVVPAESARAEARSPGLFAYVTSLAFAPDGTLFAGDSGTGKVYAIELPESTNPGARAPYNLKSIDVAVAGLLGTETRNLRFRDMALHPETKEAYLAVGRVTGDTYASVLVAVNQAGTPRLVEPARPPRVVQLPFAPASGFSFYGEVPARDLSITDMTYYDGRLIVTGLSNADFASSLWLIPVPFKGEVSTTTVEIYHAIHGQSETRAPVRALAVLKLNGEDHVVAAYTCTPLVVFPLRELVAGAHVVGKTIGELGYGNTPIDILSFTGQNAEQKPFEVLFLSHKNQAAQVIGVAAVEAAAKEAGLARPVTTSQRVDLGAFAPPMTSLMHIDDQDPYHLVALRRDVDRGTVELVSYLKNVYFRLSDFQSEYEIPGYEFSADQDAIRQFQNKMKADEGKQKFVVP